jgi:hypothetical protein
VDPAARTHVRDRISQVEMRVAHVFIRERIPAKRIETGAPGRSRGE